MAFKKLDGEPTERKTIDDYFKPVSHKKVALKLAVYSRAKRGKTHVGISSVLYLLKNCPGARLFIMDTEGDANVNASTWPQEVQDQIKILDCVAWADKENRRVDLVESLRISQDAMDVLTDYIIDKEKKGVECHDIIMIDSCTDIWEWLSMWLETIETRKNKKDGSMMQTEWGIANKKYVDFIRLMLRTNLHVIATFRSHQAYYKSEPQDYDIPKWQKNTDFWFNCIMEVKKMGNEHWFYFKGGRFGDLPENEPMVNPTWEDIKNKVSSYSSLEFV